MALEAKYSVDVVSLDREHQQLVEGIERLFGTIHASTDPQPFLDGLDALIAVVAAHFDHEERVMRNIGMPNLDRHCHIHRALLAEIQDFRADMAAGGFNIDTVGKVEDFLRFWLFRHISGEDQMIGQHINRA